MAGCKIVSNVFSSLSFLLCNKNKGLASRGPRIGRLVRLDLTATLCAPSQSLDQVISENAGLILTSLKGKSILVLET